MQAIIDINPIKICLPDGDRKSFLIYGDLRNLFNVKWQADAVKKVRAIVKGLNLKPNPTIYYEENCTGIQSKSADIFIILLKELLIPFNLSGGEVPIQWEDVFKKIRSWKIPKKQKWKVGDIFSIKLQDSSFCFGQVVGDYPTIALFDVKKTEEIISMDELENKKIITILHFTSNKLNNWSWKVLANSKLLADKDSGMTGKDTPRIGHRSFSSSVLDSICDYYWFNIMNWEKEDDIKELLLI